MKAARTTSYSSTSKVKPFSLLATCDEEPDANNGCSELSSPSMPAPKDYGKAAGSEVDKLTQRKTVVGATEKKIMRHKTKSYENYGSLEETSKSFEDYVVSR